MYGPAYGILVHIVSASSKDVRKYIVWQSGKSDTIPESNQASDGRKCKAHYA